jgi:hypothetical protein
LVAPEVSRATLTWVAPGFNSFNVTPSIAPVTVLDALDTLTPSTVSFASCATCDCVRFCVPAGS